MSSAQPPDHDGYRGLLFPEPLGDFIAVEFRHIEIEHYRINRVLANERNSSWSIGSRKDSMAFASEESFFNLKNGGVVINTEDCCHGQLSNMLLLA
jgi:hypothetical protein